jgi:uncharacterized protein involved in response to NO
LFLPANLPVNHLQFPAINHHRLHVIAVGDCGLMQLPDAALMRKPVAHSGKRQQQYQQQRQ